MESKLFIDINSANRAPQITIKAKHSEDPRDTLVSMLSTESMPGINDGYCRIERWSAGDGLETVVVTPIHPLEMVKHVDLIRDNAAKFSAATGVGE